jgi:hypothetical protein
MVGSGARRCRSAGATKFGMPPVGMLPDLYCFHRHLCQLLAVSFLPLIEAKREGQVLTPDAIHQFIRDFTDGTIPDYQMPRCSWPSIFAG